MGRLSQGLRAFNDEIAAHDATRYSVRRSMG